MGHHIDPLSGKFQSDKHPELPPDRIRVNLENPKSEQALRQLAINYRETDRELADDLNTRLDDLHGGGNRGGIRVLLDLRVTHVGEGVYEDMRIFLGDKDVTAVFDEHLFKNTPEAHDCLAYVLADLFEHELGGGLGGTRQEAPMSDGRQTMCEIRIQKETLVGAEDPIAVVAEMIREGLSSEAENPDGFQVGVSDWPQLRITFEHG